MNKFNWEHYDDPTPHQALSAINAEMKAVKAYRSLVYICFPYAGNIAGNVENVRRYYFPRHGCGN